MLYNHFALLSILLGMASAVDYSGKPSSTNSNINIDSIRRRAKSGKGGKSGGGDEWHSSGSDDWHSSGDIDYTGRFSGSNKATFEQVNLPPEDESDIQDVLDKSTTADIRWKFDGGFTEMNYHISISLPEPGYYFHEAVFVCSAAGGMDTKGVVAFSAGFMEIDSDKIMITDRLTMDNVIPNDGPDSKCSDKYPCMIEQECLGININNMASLYQAMTNGSIALLVEWVEFESDTYTTNTAVGVARGQIFV